MKIEDIVGKQQVEAVVKHLPKAPAPAPPVKVKKSRIRGVDFRAIFYLIGVEGKTAPQILFQIQLHKLVNPLPNIPTLELALRKEGWYTRGGRGCNSNGRGGFEAEYVRKDDRTMISHSSPWSS